MGSKEVFNIIKKLNETLKSQQEAMSPDSNGRGHGRLLKTIAENEGLSGVELGLMLNIAPPVISEKLLGFEEGGLIRRERDKRDRRKNNIFITNKGIMALARRDFGKVRFEESIGNCLSDEEAKFFCEICERIIFAIKSMGTDDLNIDDNTIINFYEEQKQRNRKNDANDVLNEGK